MAEKPLQRLGILGGSFDPVHYAHLLLAESCLEQCRLDQVWLLPAASAPHKVGRQTAGAKHRIAMLQLAVGGHRALRVSSLEVDRGGVSYTCETLATIHAQYPDAELFFLMGADSLEDLPTWREPRQICQLAVPVVVRRAGSAVPDFAAFAQLVDPQRLQLFQQSQVVMPIVELSSTDIRQRVARGQSIRFRTPRAVEKYIETHRLYRHLPPG
jgi:nicotinate-nucleotide adenylyltransferase